MHPPGCCYILVGWWSPRCDMGDGLGGSPHDAAHNMGVAERFRNDVWWRRYREGAAVCMTVAAQIVESKCWHRTCLFWLSSVWSMDPSLSMGANAASGVVHMRLQPAVMCRRCRSGGGGADGRGCQCSWVSRKSLLVLPASTSRLLTLFSCVVLGRLQQ